jgi:hypothetical protein
MADNGTAGSDPTIAWNDIGGVAFQRMKTALGPAGSWTADLSGRTDGTDGIAYVDVRQNVVQQTQTAAGLTTTTPNYSLGDVLGSILTFTGFARASGGTGTITGAVLVDAGKVITSVDLYLYEQSVTLAANNAAGPGVSDADALHTLSILQLPYAQTDTNNFVAPLHSINVPYVCTGSTSLYVAMITRADFGVFTSATDLSLRLTARLD